MTDFSWLHVTDLHFGLSGQKWLWPSVKSLFFEDLANLHTHAGPLDALFFTGDIVQQGKDTEFEKVTHVFLELLNHLKTLGSSPSLFFVPGNHDLTRPSHLRPEVIALQQWGTSEDLRNAFIDDADSPYRRLVEDSFDNYRRWSNALSAKNTSGLLPGDFAATYKKDEVSIGIAGLNTSFLQLTGGDYQRRLAVTPSQFHIACNGDGALWSKRHHACILLSHHPLDWLEARALQDLCGEIFPPNRFAVHLCGHMHEAHAATKATGGAPTRRTWQAAALFGLSCWGDRKGTTRTHGYSVGRISFSADRSTIRQWPRLLRRHPDGHWEFVPDYARFSISQQDSVSTTPEAFETLRPVPTSKIADTAPTLSSKVQRASKVSETSTTLPGLLEQQNRLLKRFGDEVLNHLCQRLDPSEPVSLLRLAEELADSNQSGVTNEISPQELGRLLVDAQNHGFLPGLARGTQGYFIEENHIAFKLTKDSAAKQAIARAAATFIRSGMKVGLDGGSTTLPIADRIVLGIDADILDNILIVTNSLPIVQKFAEFIERRGWSDKESPVKVLVCGGLVRPNTKAIAEVESDADDTKQSLQMLLNRIDGLDIAFVGANGITADGGFTMPTSNELHQKLQLLDAAQSKFIVADSSKLGLRQAIQISPWDERVTLLTNRPESSSAELEKIRQLVLAAQITFAEELIR